MVSGGRRKKSWVRRASRDIKRHHTAGLFTKKTEAYNYAHGTRYSVMEFACHVRRHPRGFSKKTHLEATFALNVNKRRFSCPKKSRRRSKHRRSSRRRR